MIVLRVELRGSIDPQPEFVAEAKLIGQSPEEKEMLAHWVRALDHREGVRRLRAALAGECARHGVALSRNWPDPGLALRDVEERKPPQKLPPGFSFAGKRPR